MSIFIKAGLWLEKKTGYKGEFNLTKFVENLIATSPSGQSYKVYTALLTQTGINAPVATVLENTIGNIVWARNNTGIYQAVLLGAFTSDKTHLLCGTLQISNNSELIFYQLDQDEVILQTSINGFISDDLLSNFSIEIRVYN